MSDKTQNNEEIFVEDVEEENLVEDQELEQDTPEEVSEESQETLSDSILEVLLGEAKKKNEDEDEDEDEESDSEESDDEEEDEDEEDVAESKKKNEDDDEEEDDEDEDEESDSEESDDDEDDDEEVEVETVKPKTKAGILADAFSTIKSMKKHDLVKAYEAMQGDDEDEIEENGEKKSTRPQTKAEMVNAMYKGLREMKKDDLVAAYNAITSSMQTEEVEREVEEAFATDLKVLVDADSNLTEDFKSKASALFEAAVANKIITIKEELENTYEEALQEEIVYVRDSLIEKIDNYLTYVVEDWMTENQEYVDIKLRTEIAENFMNDLKNLFVESYIEVPESKVDLVDSLSEDVETTKRELLAISEERDTLASQIIELQREKIISEATSDFTSTQTSKFIKLLEGIEFVDASNFKSKVQVIKEYFFDEDVEEKSAPVSEESSSDETEIIVEGEVDPQADLSKKMQGYLSSLRHIQQNSHK